MDAWRDNAAKVRSGFFTNNEHTKAFPAEDDREEKELFDQSNVYASNNFSIGTYDWKDSDHPLQLVNNKWTAPVYYTDTEVWDTVNGWQLWDLARARKFEAWATLEEYTKLSVDMSAVKNAEHLHKRCKVNSGSDAAGGPYATVQLVDNDNKDMRGNICYFERENYQPGCLSCCLSCWTSYGTRSNIEQERRRWDLDEENSEDQKIQQIYDLVDGKTIHVSGDISHFTPDPLRTWNYADAD